MNSLIQGDILRNEPLHFKVTNAHMRLAFTIRDYSMQTKQTQNHETLQTSFLPIFETFIK